MFRVVVSAAAFAAVAVLVLCEPVYPAVDTKVPICRSPPQLNIVDDSAEAFEKLWDSDTSFSIITRINANGRKQYRITGDIVKFDEKSFGSLARTRQQRFTDVDEIIIDARVIYFNAPLSLDAGRVKLVADKITFGPRAQFVFTDPPHIAEPMTAVSATADYTDDYHLLPKTDGVAILARSINFEHPRNYLFYFATQPERTLQVIAEFMFLDGVRIQQVDHFIPSKLLANDSALAGAEAIHRAKARKIFMGLYRKDMNWPESFSRKIARFHAISPFQDSFKSGLLKKIAEYDSLLTEWRNAGPSLRVNQIWTFIEAGEDQYGYGPNYVPRDELDSQLNTVRHLLDELAPGNSLSQIESVILDGYKKNKPDETLLASIVDKQATLKAEFDKDRSAMNDALTRVEELQQAIASNFKDIYESTQRIKDMIADREKKKASEAEIMRATHSVAIAASFVAVTAPAAIAISTGIEAAGGYVARNQTHNQVSFGELVDLVRDGREKSVAFNAQIGKVKSSWESLSRSHETLAASVPRGTEATVDSVKSFAQSTNAFYQEIKTLYSMTDVPSTVQYNQSNAEHDDVRLQEQLRRQTNLNTEQSYRLSEIAELTDRNRRIESQLVELDGSTRELLRADVRDDQDIARWQSVAQTLRADIYIRLFREASVLRRAIFYATGRIPNGPLDVLTFADELYATSLTFSPDSVIPEQVSAEWISARFHASAARASLAIEGLVTAAETASKVARDSRTVKRVFPTSTTTLSFDSKKGSADRAFLETLNEQIREQIEQPENTDVRAPIVIPVVIRESPKRLPELFVDAVVTSMSLKSENALVGKTLKFSIYNPGFGTITIGQDCFKVDMRISDYDAENRFFSYTTSGVGHLKHTWSENIRADAGLLSERDRSDYARPPLNAPYYLYVSVEGSRNHNSWSQVPILTDFELTFVALQ